MCSAFSSTSKFSNKRIVNTVEKSFTWKNERYEKSISPLKISSISEAMGNKGLSKSINEKSTYNKLENI